ncbi:MAG: VanW family protein [Pseudonocardia sp.]
MPERQSPSGEATTRPETDGTTSANGTSSASQPDADAPAAPVIPEAGTRPATAESTADELAPTEPGDAAPAEPPDDPLPAAASVFEATATETSDLPPAPRPAQVTPGPEQSAGGSGAARPRPRPGPWPGPAPTPAGAGTPVNGADPAAAKSTAPPAAESSPPRDDRAAAPAGDEPAGGRGIRVDDSPTVVIAGGRSSTASPRTRTPTLIGSPAPTPTGSPAPTQPPPTASLPTQPPPTPPGSGSPWFDVRDSEVTHVIPRRFGALAEPEQPTESLSSASGAAPPPQQPPVPDESAGSPPRPRARLLVLAAVVAVLALLYVGDLILSLGTVPRGVTVAGVAVGGLGVEEAEGQLRAGIEPRTTRPVAVTVGGVRGELDPRAAGLDVDWQATLEQAGAQPLNPITRIISFFTAREVGVITSADEPALAAALEQLAPVVDRAPVEGTVRFDGATPVPVDPVAGQRLDVPAAVEVVQQKWAIERSVDLPLIVLDPITTPEDVVAVIDQVARPAVSAPVTLLGEAGTRATITPTVIAAALSFRAEPGGGLSPEINPAVIIEAAKPQLAAAEKPGRDASLDFASGTPVVIPSQDGRGVDYEATLKDLLDVLTGTGPRQITAVYADQPAELTTEELGALGITGLISEFQTGGFKSDSGLNIKRAAEQINGMIIEPGETFSLNGATVPRNPANGYIEAGIIEDGHPSRGVGGGVSQVATTVYNAAYFAGMVDVAHQEHSFYISRYPAGREATVFEGSIDLKFRNDNPTGVLIQTAWTPSSLTVRMFGTKRYEVTSTAGPRTNPTTPNTVRIPGEPCSASQGAPGFTITDTRTLREISTGQVRNETRTVRYNPSPIVVCGG